jgi:hypothetical protein
MPPSAPPTNDILEFLDLLAARLGMLRRGGERDIGRAAAWFVKWWRDEGGLISALDADSSLLPMDKAPLRHGWGFDFEWSIDSEKATVQEKMEECIDLYLMSAESEGREGNDISPTQVKKKDKIAKRTRKTNPVGKS